MFQRLTRVSYRGARVGDKVLILYGENKRKVGQIRRIAKGDMFPFKVKVEGLPTIISYSKMDFRVLKDEWIQEGETR